MKTNILWDLKFTWLFFITGYGLTFLSEFLKNDILFVISIIIICIAFFPTFPAELSYRIEKERKTTNEKN